MGKNILKKVLIIAFFPIAIIFFITKFLYKFIQKHLLKKYLSTITLSNIDSLSGDEFEEVLYYLFLSLGIKVQKTKKSHDYGADLILNIDGKIIVIQCKLYNKHSVGNSAVQEIFTATNYYNAHLGVIATNSHFSKSAITLAEKAGVILWNRDSLSNLLKLNNARNLRMSILNQIKMNSA